MNVSEIIRALRRDMVETGSLLCTGCGHEHNCTTQGCAITREAAAALERGQWISVKDRLPEDGIYLTVMDGDLVGQKEPFTCMCGIEKGKWDEFDAVLYWMPLPEPPVEKGMK